MIETFTPAELRAKDAWIAEHVFGWHEVEFNSYNHSICSKCGNGFGARHKHYLPEFHGIMTGSVPHYTTDKASSDALDDAILNEIGFNGVATFKQLGGFTMTQAYGNRKIEVSHPDKKICRVLFSVKLFGGLK